MPQPEAINEKRTLTDRDIDKEVENDSRESGSSKNVYVTGIEKQKKEGESSRDSAIEIQNTDESGVKAEDLEESLQKHSTNFQKGSISH